VRRLAQLVLVALGLLTIIAGFLIAPLPGPLGLPLAALGLMIVLRNSYTARRGFVRMNRRHPKWVSPFRTLLRPNAEVAPGFYRLALRLERLLLRGRFSVFANLRRRIRRR
jgi:hypothetical protein